MSPSGTNRAPRLRGTPDLTALPLGSRGAFVASRLDGIADVEELSESTGVPAEEVARVLQLLDEAGFLEWVDKTSRRPVRRDRTASSSQTRAASEPIRTLPPPPGTPRRLYDPQELEEAGVDLDVERRRTILDTYYRLSTVTLYDVLGVPTNAPKAEIRSAYFRLSKVFHPDTMFGKNLGSYKGKMEVVFKRLTEAYEILGKRKSREEYDDYLQVKDRADQAEQSIERTARKAERLARSAQSESQAPKPPSERPPGPGLRPPEKPLAPAASVDAASASPLPAAEAPTSSSGAPAPAQPSRAASANPRRTESHTPLATAVSSAPEKAPTSTVATTAAPAAAAIPGRASVTPAKEAPLAPARPMSADGVERARQLMAQKIAAATKRDVPGAPRRRRVSSKRNVSAQGSGGPRVLPGREAVFRGLTGSLKQAAAHTGGFDRAQVHLEQALASEKDGNLLAAVNALRLAVALSQGRADVEAEYNRVRARYAAEMAGTFEKQAKYESHLGKWTEAALSWSKVCEGRPSDGKAHLQAALALYESGGDLAKAKRFGERARVLLEDDVLAHRVLGKIYAGLGMKVNARRAFETVLKRDPNDADIRKRLKAL